MIVTCNTCNIDFEVKLETDKKKIDGTEVRRTYYMCPLCRALYNVSFETDKTKNLRKQLNRLTSRDRYKIKLKRKQLRQEMEENKQKYENMF